MIERIRGFLHYSVGLSLKRVANGHNLDLPIGRRRWMHGILQLLLAETDRLQAFCRYLERRHQNVADGGGSSWAEGEIIAPPAGRVGMADNQEAISQQCRIGQNIG